jgi:hypothetical protein
MRNIFLLLFGSIFIFMVVMTVLTSMHAPLFGAGGVHPDVRAQFNASPWAVATLYDAYFGFLTFFCWVAYKEKSFFAKAVWFILIMALGNIAMSFYVLRQLLRLNPGEPLSKLFQNVEAK